MRRAHEADAALFAARAAYIAGFNGTATVEAGRRFGIPLSGTMAHSFIEAHDREEDAFRHFISSRPKAVTLLIDTYDMPRAAHRIVALARELQSRGAPAAIHAVRIDSGDIAKDTRTVRDIFDRAGYRQILIFLSEASISIASTTWFMMVFRWTHSAWAHRSTFQMMPRRSI